MDMVLITFRHIYVTHIKFRGILVISGNGVNMTYLILFGT